MKSTIQIRAGPYQTIAKKLHIETIASRNYGPKKPQNQRERILNSLNIKIMIDILIKNELGTKPIATANSYNQITAKDLHVSNLDPSNLIHVGKEYMVGLDDESNMRGRTCTALDVDARTASFVL